MSAIDETLAERETRYGNFALHAAITQEIKRAMLKGRNWNHLEADQKEALEMLAHKIGRILNGDHNYIDSWHDIIGYVRLVETRLEEEQNPAGFATYEELIPGHVTLTNLDELRHRTPPWLNKK